MTLDAQVAQVVFAAHLLEKAVHEQTRWTMTYGGRTVPAVHTLIEHGACLTGTFSDHCHLSVPDPRITLEFEGEVVGVKAIIFPGDGCFEVSWAIEGRVTASV